MNKFQTIQKGEKPYISDKSCVIIVEALDRKEIELRGEC